MRMILALGLLAWAATAQAQPRTNLSIEGNWRINAILPIEASAAAPKLVVSEAEARRLAPVLGAALAESFIQDLDPEFPQLVKDADGLAIVRGERRTRALVQPGDGRLPYTPAGRKELETPPPAFEATAAENPEQRPNAERCLVGSGQPPFSGFNLDNHIQILATRDHVVIHTEYGDEVRVVRLGAAHGPKALWSRLGDSIGHFEGKTLVIETVGMPDADRVRIGPVLLVPGDATVIERFTPVSDKELLYQYTVVDPKTYAAPWLGEFSWFRTKMRMYEHACHEGNYSLPNILAGARHEEAAAKGSR